MPFRYRHSRCHHDTDHHFVQKGFTEEEAIERAGKVFETLDKNNDGGLAEDEFVKVIIMQRLMFAMSKRTSWGRGYAPSYA